MIVGSIAEIRIIIQDLLVENGEADHIRDDDSLFVSGHLDSVTAIDLIMRLEKDFGLNFSHIDFDVVMIDSIRSISQLVDGQRVS